MIANKGSPNGYSGIEVPVGTGGIDTVIDEPSSVKSTQLLQPPLTAHAWALY